MHARKGVKVPVFRLRHANGIIIYATIIVTIFLMRRIASKRDTVVGNKRSRFARKNAISR
jgi:hypothetical protein